MHDQGRYQILRGAADDGAFSPPFPDERLSDSVAIIGKIVVAGIKSRERIESAALEMRQLVCQYVERIDDDHRTELRALAHGDRCRLALGIDDENGAAQCREVGDD